MEVSKTQDSSREVQEPVLDVNRKEIPTQEPVISLGDSPNHYASQERTILKSDKGHDSPPKSPDSAIGQTPDSSPTFSEEKSIITEKVEDQGVQDSKEISPSNLFLGDEQAEDERVSSDSSSSSSIVIVNQDELAQELECVPEEGGIPEQQQVFEFEKDKGEDVKNYIGEPAKVMDEEQESKLTEISSQNGKEEEEYEETSQETEFSHDTNPNYVGEPSEVMGEEQESKLTQISSQNGKEEEEGYEETSQETEFSHDTNPDDATQEEDLQITPPDLSSQPSLQETSMVIIGESMIQEIRSDDLQNEGNEELKPEDIPITEALHKEVPVPTLEPVSTMEAVPAVETISRVDAVPTVEAVSVETSGAGDVEVDLAVEDVETSNTLEALETGNTIELVETVPEVKPSPSMEAPPVVQKSELEEPAEQGNVPSALIEAVEDEIIDQVKEEVELGETEGEEEVSGQEMVVEASMQFPLTSKEQEIEKEELKEVVEDKVTIQVKQEISAPAVQKEATPSGCESDVEDNIEEQHNSPRSAVASPAAASLARLGTNLQLPSTVTRLESPTGSVVFLVGTAHFSLESQEDVAMTIREVRPDIVVVELCKARTAILQLDEETILQESRNLDFKKVRMIMNQHGKIQGLLYWLLLSVSAHITKQLGMAPGGEFRAAFAEARKSSAGCIIQLGDRPIHITLSRALASLSVWHKVKLAWHIITSKEPISKEEVEKCKQNDFLEEMLAEMTGEFPAISEVFVKERDIYLTRSLQAAAQPVPDATSPTGYSPRVVVGVVGIGHVQGIVQRWGTVTEADIPPIMRIPPPSLSSRILTLTFKVSMYSLIGYGVYKLLPSATKEGIHSSFRTLVTTVSGKQTTL